VKDLVVVACPDPAPPRAERPSVPLAVEMAFDPTSTRHLRVRPREPLDVRLTEVMVSAETPRRRHGGG
jgi:hypothetical protein